MACTAGSPIFSGLPAANPPTTSKFEGCLEFSAGAAAASSSSSSSTSASPRDGWEEERPSSRKDEEEQEKDAEELSCEPCLSAHANAALREGDHVWQPFEEPCQVPGCRKLLHRRIVSCELGCSESEAQECLRARVALSQRLVQKLQPSLKESRVIPSDVVGKLDGVFFLHTCPCCGTEGALVKNSVCQHWACRECWERHAESKLEDLETKGVAYPACAMSGCDVHVNTEPMVSEMNAAKYPNFDRCAKAVAQARMQLEDWKELARRSDDWTAHGPVCTVCDEHRVATLFNSVEPEHPGACIDCWKQWVEVQFEGFPARRAPLRGFGASSSSTSSSSSDSTTARAISEPLWGAITRVSEVALRCDTQLKTRARLENNPLFPPTMQVDCPRPDCIGLGYLGYDTVMCFVCEHRWSAEDAEALSTDTKEEHIMGLGMKRCPKCQEYIEKNGGCDHMRCRCYYEFYWSTLKPYPR